MLGSTGRTACASSTAPPRRSAPCVSCRPVPARAATCHAGVPRRAQTHTVPPLRAAGTRCRDAGRTPSMRDTTTLRHPPAVPHGLARDSPCTGRKAPGSVGGRVRLSPDAATPARRWSSTAELVAPLHGKSPAPARSPVSLLPGCAAPESWCVVLGSTCGFCSGRSFSPMR